MEGLAIGRKGEWERRMERKSEFALINWAEDEQILDISQTYGESADMLRVRIVQTYQQGARRAKFSHVANPASRRIEFFQCG